MEQNKSEESLAWLGDSLSEAKEGAESVEANQALDDAFYRGGDQEIDIGDIAQSNRNES